MYVLLTASASAAEDDAAAALSSYEGDVIETPWLAEISYVLDRQSDGRKWCARGPRPTEQCLELWASPVGTLYHTLDALPRQGEAAALARVHASGNGGRTARL